MTHRKLDVAIVADDLTGALDTAAPFAALGFKTRVLLDVDQAASAARTDTQVLSLTSESRHLSLTEAEERIRLAIAAALAHAPRVLLKKIDSTLRGNVAIEILAGLRASGRRHALIAQAVPRHGRIMRDGEVFIDGVPLRQTQIGSDALSPPPSAPLPQVLRAASADMTVHSWRRGAGFTFSGENGLHAYVADCETEADLDTIARFALDHCDKVLLVGASGLGAAIARRLADEATPGILRRELHISDPTVKPILFVIGSRTKSSAEQIVKLRDAGAEELATPLSVSEREIEQLLDDESDRDVQSMALIVRPEVSREPIKIRASEVVLTLGRVAASLVRRLKVDTVVMVGGDTAFATFQALGVREAAVLGELMPGIAAGTMRVGLRPVTFVTKAGGFGGPDALIEILRRLQNA